MYKIDYEPCTTEPTFRRLFICYKPISVGLIEGCRPFIGIDGCFLKGPYKGQLLSAVSLDGNNGLFPIGIAIVEAENNESWSWFLEHLLNIIGPAKGGVPWTFMSDRQKVSDTTLLTIFLSTNQFSYAMVLM